MILSTVKLTGFRNFKSATINFNEKTLIIGANEVGKTNLLWALRLLLDKSLSDFDRDPKDSDFYAYDDINHFEILLEFNEVIEDCVVSKPGLKGKISDDNKLFLAYRAKRDAITKAKSYRLFAGHQSDQLEEIEDRFYIKALNLKYISSRRDFYNYINREKRTLFQEAKKNRTEEQITADNALTEEISDDLEKVDEKIPKLSYIKTATESINTELGKLSIHHENQQIVFDATSSNIDNFIGNVSIASKNNDKSLFVGGDGRLNQIYLSLWAARNEISEDRLEEVSIICIEEPEAHLYPHQQRKLAEYLGETINGQVIITSHSPQITCEFSPNSIVRLYLDEEGSVAASDGCSEIIETAFMDFGYRLSVIPSEAFFADIVLLVEGPSEELFYKTLSRQLSIDLDRLNISVLMVDGIGFDTFIKILNCLEIKWVLRTDNDIFKVQNKETYRFAGVQRLIHLFKQSGKADESVENILSANEHLITDFAMSSEPPIENAQAAKLIIDALKTFNLFISTKDLENDLFNSEIKPELRAFFSDISEDRIITEMQKRKATSMYNFLKSQKECLSKLSSNTLASPLLRCKEMIDTNRYGAHPTTTVNP